MKRLFLTSSAHLVASHIANKIKLKSNNKLVFINTAAEIGETDLSWMDNDRNALIKAGFNTTDYTITGKIETQLRKDLEQYDFIYVEGGNQFYLLKMAQENGFIHVIKELILSKNKVYIGTSAGSIIASSNIYPTYRPEKADKVNLINYNGFNFVDFIVFPHWGSEHFKDVYLKQRMSHAYNTDSQIILLNDYQYVEVKDDWHKIIDVRK